MHSCLRFLPILFTTSRTIIERFLRESRVGWLFSYQNFISQCASFFYYCLWQFWHLDVRNYRVLVTKQRQGKRNEKCMQMILLHWDINAYVCILKVTGCEISVYRQSLYHLSSSLFSCCCMSIQEGIRRQPILFCNSRNLGGGKAYSEQKGPETRKHGRFMKVVIINCDDMTITYYLCMQSKRS